MGLLTGGAAPLTTSFLAASALAAWKGDLTNLSKLASYSAATVSGMFLVVLPAYRLSPFHGLYEYPGPLLHKISELPMLYYTLRGITHLKVRELHDKYGRTVQTGPNSVSFLSPASISTIYGSATALDKASAYDIQHMDGAGLFFMKDKATHARRRRIWNRSFSDNAIAGYHDEVVQCVEHLIRCLLKRTADNGKVDLVKLLPQYSFDSLNSVFFSGHAFSPSLMDSDDPKRIVAQAAEFFAISESLTHIEPLFHMTMKIPGIGALLEFEKISIRSAESWLRNGPSFADGISHWFDTDPSQPKLEAADLPIEAETLLIGGADTIGGVSVSVVFQLLANPKWLAALRKELDEQFEGPPAGHQLRDLDDLPIINAVLQESLRLGAPLPGLPRLVPESGTVIDGNFLPAGTFVSVPIGAYHVDEEYFPDPHVFDPSRWIDEGRFAPSKHLLLAFSAGPFNCVGQKLVFMQLRIMLAMVLTQLDITPTAGFDAAKFWAGVRNRRTTTFTEPLWVKVTPRARK
ncbi:cytochrome P450 [Mycena belliarum]|uniref:Cytochrome P450 n=1 Tax=Mycena belliarum TaxID=1033014 RepID=A0AAD6XLS3_9AGAR|nr:cytochrome P450 [Mycena belliae]